MFPSRIRLSPTGDSAMQSIRVMIAAGFMGRRRNDARVGATGQTRGRSTLRARLRSWTALDQSRWSPGLNVGKPLDVSDHCYLIHHAQGYFVWDTEIGDAVAAMPDGQPGQNGSPTWRRPKTLAAQLE
jgi:hypothetical protein